MSVVMSAVHAVHTVAVNAAAALSTAVLSTKGGAEFDPNKVTPGPAGFIATAAFAAAVILLGFLLVKRLRRNAYRHEIRDEIAAELAAAEGAPGAAAGGAGGAGSEASGADGQSPASGGSRPDGA